MWDWNFAAMIFPQILKAMPVTIAATLVGFIFAMITGLLLALARRSKLRPLKWLTVGFIEFVRSTPLLLQLFFIYNVLPFAGLTLSPFVAGVVGLGLHYSTYISEVYRTGIDAVPKGQWEASKALNFSKLQTWFGIVLPQAIPPIIPVLGNYLILMFKETPLLSAISVVEMLQTANTIGSHYFRYIEGYTIVGLLFLLLSYPSALLVRRLELRMKRQ